MEKVSFVQAINKTHTLISTRKGIYGLYAFLFFVLTMWGESFQQYKGAEDLALSQLGFVLIAILLMFLANITLFHFSVSTSRGRTSFFPKNPIWTAIQYFLSAIAVYFVSGLASLPGFLAVFMAEGFLDDNVDTTAIVAMVVSTLLLIASLLLALNLAVRLSMSLVAAAAEDPSSLKDAWRMTKGYSLKLMFLGLIALVIIIGSDFGVAWLFDNDMLEPSMGVVIANSLVSVVLLLWFKVYASVLYTDLEKNYTASIMARSKGDTPTDQPASFTLTES